MRGRSKAKRTVPMPMPMPIPIPLTADGFPLAEACCRRFRSRSAEGGSR